MSKPVKKTGLFDNVVAELKKYNIEYVELSGVQANPRLDLVYKGIEICKQNNVEFITTARSMPSMAIIGLAIFPLRTIPPACGTSPTKSSRNLAAHI